jgi:hypothetical protein
MGLIIVLFAQNSFAQLTGTKTIGVSGDYLTVEAAITDLNTQGTAAPGVTFLIASGYYTPAASLNITTTTGSATAPIEFRPDAGATVWIDVIGGAAGNALTIGAGVSYLTINGSNTGNGTDRSLRIANITPGSNLGIKGLGNNLNCTIKNTIVRTGAATTTNWNATACRGIDINYQGTGPESDGWIVDNCQVSNAAVGIRVEGNSTTPLMLGPIIRNNTVDSCGLQGILNTYNISAKIYNNTVSCQLGTGTSPVGISMGTANTGNFRVYNNTVFNVKSTSTSTTATAYIAGINSISTVANNSRAGAIFNNIVYDINYTAATGTAPVAGIWVSNTSTNATPDTIAYNTVSLTGTNTPNRPSSAFSFSSTTANHKVFLRNNILSNTMTSGTGVSSAIFKASTTASILILSNYNDLYVGTTSSTKVIGRISTTNYQNIGDWRTISGGDGNSFVENPPFISPTNLKIADGTSTQLESGGTPISVTFDIDNVTRNSSTPDIGADEFNGIPVDLTGPAISYTALANTSLTTNRTLTDFAAITDFSGVNTTPGTKPRIYYKKSTDANAFVGNTSLDNGWKWTEATDGASPFDFVIDYSIINGGSVSQGETINYFVVAQDIVSTPNVSSNPSGVTATSVGSITVAPTPNSYIITAPPLSGDYTVGLAMFRGVTGMNIQSEARVRKVMKEVTLETDASSVKDGKDTPKEMTAFPVLEKGKTVMQEVEETYYVLTVNGKEYNGPSYHEFSAAERIQHNLTTDMVGVYTTITAAVADANLRGLGGATRFLLTDALYNESAFINVPAIEGASSSNTLTVKPAAGVTTTVQVNSTSPVFVSNCNYFTIDGSNTEGGVTRNLTLQNLNSGTASGGFFSGSSVATNNNTVKNCIVRNQATTVAYGIVFNTGANNTATNNWVYKANLGIQSQGSLGQSSNVTIDNNLIGSDTARIGVTGIGILATNIFNVVRNTVVEINNAVAQLNRGIITGVSGTAAVNGTISNNRIDNLVNTNVNGWGSHGIYIGGGLNCNTSVYNNVVTRMLGTGDNMATTACQYNPSGIYVAGASSGVNIYYNSIYLTGNNGTYAPSAGWTGSSCVMIDTLCSGINMRNNILRNDATGDAPTYTPYVVVSKAGGSPFSSLNYNLYYINTGEASQQFGRYASANYADFTSWQATGVGEGNSSTFAEAGFTSATDLTIDPSSAFAWNVNGMGIPISTVSMDYTGSSRSTTIATGATDLGAYNVTPSGNPPTALASGAPANSTTTTYSVNGRQIGAITWGAGGTVPASVDATFYPGVNPPGAGAYPVGNGYWVFTPTGGSGYSYDITINYNEAQLGTITSEADVRLAKSDNGGALYTPYLIPGTGTGEYELNTTANTIKVYGLTSFSTFAITDTDDPLPVELSSFTSNVNRNTVDLSWSTVSEENNAGFDIERKVVSSNSWIKIGNVAGSGTSNVAHSYKFTDRNVNTEKYNYRLKQIDANGNYTYHNLANEVIVGVPSKFEISQNYPNPFNPSTKINFDLPFDSKVSIKIYDIMGREMYQLMNETKTAGYHTVQFNALNLSSGTYFYMISAQGGNQSFNKTLKMMLVK